MAASGRATWHADVSMTSSGGSGMMTSAWPMLTSSLTRSMLTRSTVNGRRSRGLTGQSAGLTDRWDPRVSAVERKEKESARRWAECPPGLLFLRGLLGRTRPVLSSFFFFLFLLSPLRLTTPAHLSATPVSRAASSRSDANSSACVRVCVSCVC